MNINREIAEKVMGWDGYKADMLMGDGWSPSTNIQHTIEVEEEMAKQGWFITISRERNGDRPTMMYFVRCYKMSLTALNNPVIGRAYSERSGNLPKAICEVSLRALEGK